MYQTSLPLHSQFDLARLKLHLQEHPEQASQIAIAQFTYHLELLEENRKLEKKLESASEPSFPRLSKTRLQKEYENLRQEHKKLLNAYARVNEENHQLKHRRKSPTNNHSPILCFLKRFLNLGNWHFPLP